ncbi:MAG: aminotransferase class IV, partial [Candidatus Bipolaricaulia bacterium]
MATDSDFELFESILWEPADGWFLLELHLGRLAQGAHAFGFNYDEARIRTALEETATTLGDEPYKVRLYLAPHGTVRTEARTFAQDPIPDPLPIGLARRPIRSDDPLVLNKTTDRTPYDEARATRPDCEDVLLWNEREELTETTRANLVVRIDGELLTPPLSSGLLNGTFRQWLLNRGEICEHVLHVDDVERFEAMWLVSSIRRWYGVEWVPLSG